MATPGADTVGLNAMLGAGPQEVKLAIALGLVAA